MSILYDVKSFLLFVALSNCEVWLLTTEKFQAVAHFFPVQQQKVKVGKVLLAFREVIQPQVKYSTRIDLVPRQNGVTE